MWLLEQRVETPVQKVEAPAPREMHRRQGEEDWGKEIELAGASSQQPTAYSKSLLYPLTETSWFPAVCSS